MLNVAVVDVSEGSADSASIDNFPFCLLRQNLEQEVCNCILVPCLS